MPGAWGEFLRIRGALNGAAGRLSDAYHDIAQSASVFELIGEGVLAMEAEATVETLMHTIHAHPTLYEAVGEAFNAVYGLAINA